MHEIEIGKDQIISDPEKLSVLFKEMVQMCLWCVLASPLTDRVLPTFDKHYS